MTRKGNYISNDRITKKYELTPIIEDNEYMKEYMMDTLKDFRNDKPSKDFEFSRKSSDTNGVIDRRYGRKTDNDIYKPDLFLGDLSRDPRSIADSADLNGFRKFMEHRQEALKKNLLNDDNLAVNSKTLTHAESRRKKDEAFYRVKERYTNYQNSQENLNHGRSLFNLSNDSKNLEKKKSLSTYIINSHKSDYNNRDKGNGNGNGKWIREYNHKSNNGLKDVDYSEGKKIESKTGNINNGRNIKYISPFKVSKKSRQNDITHKKINLNIENKGDRNILYKNKPTIENFAERKMESLDNMKLTSKNSYNTDLLINNSDRSKNGKSMDASTIRDGLSNQIESHKKSNASKYLLERLNRNSIILDKNQESILVRNVDSETHKMKSNNLENSNKYIKTASNDDIKNIIRQSNFTGDRVEKVSKENNHSIFSKGSIKKILNPLQDISKFAIMNPDIDSTKKSKEEISIYNFKSKKPETFKFVENAGLIEIGLYSHTRDSSVMDSHGNKSSTTEYKIKNIDDFDLETKPSHYEQKESNIAAGTVGIMGSKFIRDKIERDDKNYELEGGMEIVSRLK